MIDVVDIEEANIAIHAYFDGDPPKEAALLGLVLVAREIATISEKLDQIDANLFRIALGIEALARAATKVGEE